jgi:hypothetical protein
VPANFAFAAKGTVQRVLLRMDWSESGNFKNRTGALMSFFPKKEKKFIPFFCLSICSYVPNLARC